MQIRLGRCRLDAISSFNEYVLALRRHDWYHTYSDDNRYYVDGEKSFKLLTEAQPKYDPTWGVWNHYAPNDFKVENER